MTFKNIDSLKTWINRLEKLLEFLLIETDFLVVCCWKNYQRIGINKLCIAAMFYLIAVAQVDLEALHLGSDKRIRELMLNVEEGKIKFKLHKSAVMKFFDPDITKGPFNNALR